MSKTVSGFSPGTTSRTKAPTFVSGGNSIMPDAPSPICSSFSEQHMPNDSTPRSLLFLILNPPSGTTAPIFANAVLMPRRMFGAPHTTWNSSAPSVTRQTCRWSLSGCGSHAVTSTTTNESDSGTPPTVSTDSTCSPARVSFSASSAGATSSTFT